MLALRAARYRRGLTTRDPTEPACWCGGKGGRSVAYLPDPLDAAPSELDLFQVYGEYCPCEAGKTLKPLEDALRAAVFAAQDELRVARLWGAAGVPPHYQDLTLETFPTTPETAPAVARIREWLTTSDRWLLLWGAYGTGKTGLAVAAMRERVHGAASGGTAARARFVTVPDMLTRLRQSYDRGGSDGGGRGAGGPGGPGGPGASERELLDDLNEAPLLVLDDLGAERATDWAVERLFGVLNRRHDWHRQTVLTSNLDPMRLAQHLGERIAWRIIEMCRREGEERAHFMVEVGGPNLRDRAAGATRTTRSEPA
jgi:DNA replication protein DnaC